MSEEIVADLVRDRGEKKPLEADRQITAAIAASEQTARNKKRARNFNRGIIGTLLILLLWGIWYLFQPLEGSMGYGVCKVFLERQSLFPGHARLSTVEEFDSSVRIWYARTSSFGEYRLEPIQCYFRPDPTYGLALDRVKINRRDVDPAIVDSFNKTLLAILAHPPDLSLPAPLPDRLEDLNIETDKFRKAIFGE